jgi:hypothetical protein
MLFFAFACLLIAAIVYALPWQALIVIGFLLALFGGLIWLIRPSPHRPPADQSKGPK